MLLLLALSCSSPELQPEYEARHQAAIADPGPAPKGWRTEAGLRLSAPLLQSLMAAAISDESSSAEPMDVGVLGSVQPELTLKQLHFIASDCQDCVGVKGKLSGTAKIKVAGVTKKVPFQGSFNMDLVFSTETRGTLRHVLLTPKSVNKLKIKFDGLSAWNLSGPLERYGQQVLEQVEPIDLGDLGGPELHLRDARVREESGTLRIELLTDAPTTSAVSAWPDPPEQGFQAVVSEGALLAMARREAFAAGDVAEGKGIYLEPTSLDLEGSTFTMGLRVWRLGGPDWWRDYVVHGDLSVVKRHVVLAASSVEEGDKSPGAGLADPLVLLAEGYLLSVIQDSAQGALPTSEAFEVGNEHWIVYVEQAQGVGDSLVLSGQVSVKAKSEGRRQE